MFVQIAQAAQQAAQEIKEPIITWNLFVTGFGMPLGLYILGHYIKLKIEAKSKVDSELEIEKKKSLETWQANMEKTILQWQEGAKERTAGICKKLDEIKDEVHAKQGIRACEKKHDDIDKKHDTLEKKLNHIEEKVFYA